MVFETLQNSDFIISLYHFSELEIEDSYFIGNIGWLPVLQTTIFEEDSKGRNTQGEAIKLMSI